MARIVTHNEDFGPVVFKTRLTPIPLPGLVEVSDLLRSETQVLTRVSLRYLHLTYLDKPNIDALTYRLKS